MDTCNKYVFAEIKEIMKVNLMNFSKLFHVKPIIREKNA